MIHPSSTQQYFPVGMEVAAKFWTLSDAPDTNTPDTRFCTVTVPDPGVVPDRAVIVPEVRQTCPTLPDSRGVRLGGVYVRGSDSTR
jgi:hypothetical protein